MTLGQRVTVLKDGVLQQVDTPQNLYNGPANLFVAAFIGSPPMNMVEAEVTETSIDFGGFSPPPEPRRAQRPRGSHVILGIRPPTWRTATSGTGGTADTSRSEQK